MEPVEPRIANFFTSSIFSECWLGCVVFVGSMEVYPSPRFGLKYLDSTVYVG